VTYSAKIHIDTCALIGRVIIDMIAVDLHIAPHTAIEDEGILWGKGLLMGRIAECANTIIAQELFCGVT
jgi:alanine racemase